jgi:hypothetical protein
MQMDGNVLLVAAWASQVTERMTGCSDTAAAATQVPAAAVEGSKGKL